MRESWAAHLLERLLFFTNNDLLDNSVIDTTDLCCMTYKTTSKRCFSKLSRFLCNEIVNF